MKKIGSIIRTILFRSLSFENYLLVLSKAYFFAFNTGVLKLSKAFEYPYFLKHLIKQGDVVVDIGANLGYLTVHFSRLVGEAGKVHAVEPVEPVRNVLRQNTKRLKNLQIYPFALGTENKTIELGNNTRLKKGYIGSGSHFVVDNRAAVSAETDIVSEAMMRRGSELFRDLEQLDFIKCDIEGYETVVLPEMRWLINRYKPILLVETAGANRRQMLEFFGKNGFDAFTLQNGRLLPTNEKESRDILFIHSDKLNHSINKYIQR
ncbi:FkbM family methyltransferase [uncultured Sunxiuqinia sp.]|uniref:FkbM family methyltransferase n=1 Tax=uncultured Sunxiuqinia sp. TaxID=1573825 RepID=UPI0030D9592B|tara:strand:+ start:1842 stop:2630 length:789 start_codon:yes stop_codon:yes gene_type:complete